MELTEKESNIEQHKKGGFLRNLFASLFNSSSPEAEKRRKLKSIAKTFSKCKYHNYFKINSLETTSSFGKLIYDIYKATFQAQIFFKSAQNPSVFKNHILNYSLSENQLKLLEHFDEQKIYEVAKKVPIEKIHSQLEKELQLFSNEFDGEKVNKVENLYKAFSAFKDFCCFDYYLIIKKYDSSFQEYNFTNVPRLDKINADYILDNLKDFITVAYAITDDTIIWNDLFEMFKKTQGKELIPFGTWKKIVAKIKSIQISRALDMMIKLISQEPEQIVEPDLKIESIVEPYLDKIQNEVLQTVYKIEAQQKESKTNSLCMQIFGTAEPQSLIYYIQSFNVALEKKDLDTLEYTEPLNYLKTFLLEFVKKDIREFYDVIVIRGQWDATLSAPISNAYQNLLKTSESITSFDESFSEEGTSGSKIKTLLPKTTHDTGAESIINRVISDANEQAREYLINSTQELITIGKGIKQLLEDYIKQKPVMVQNWKELEKFVESPMKTFLVNIYKKIYLFVQLMQQYLSNSSQI